MGPVLDCLLVGLPAILGTIAIHGVNLCGAFAGFATALYCSAGSNTTVGAGTAALPPEWQLHGPMEAAAGMLMFGVSTSLIFAIVQRLIQARLEHVV